MKIYEVNEKMFFDYFPPETRNISVNGKVICNLGKEVICDRCNADVFFEENEVMSNAFMISNSDEPKTTEDISEIICKRCFDELKKTGRMVKDS